MILSTKTDTLSRRRNLGDVSDILEARNNLGLGESQNVEFGSILTDYLSPPSGTVEINNGTPGTLRDLSARAGTFSGDVVTGSRVRGALLSAGFHVALGEFLSEDVLVARNASGPTLDSRAAGGFRSRTLDGSAAAPIDISVIKKDGTALVTFDAAGAGSTQFQGSIYSTTTTHVGQLLTWNAPGTSGSIIDGRTNGRFKLVDTTELIGVLLDVNTDGTLKLRNRANSADGAFTAGAITASTVNLSGREITSVGTTGVKVVGDAATGTFPFSVYSGSNRCLDVQLASVVIPTYLNVADGYVHVLKSGTDGAIRSFNNLVLAPAALGGTGVVSVAGAITASGDAIIRGNTIGGTAGNMTLGGILELRNGGPGGNSACIFSTNNTGVIFGQTAGSSPWGGFYAGVLYAGGTPNSSGPRMQIDGDGSYTESIGLWGVTPPAVQPAAPTTLAEVIAGLQSYGIFAT